MQLIRIVILLLAIGLFVAACDEQTPQDRERNTNQQNYTKQTEIQPAETMDWSPTRGGVNYWMETWEEPHKLSYVYLLAANGQMIGYYVAEGLPISYCASLTPTDRYVDTPNDGDSVPDHTEQAPSMDGVYYSGNECSQYYMKDALTGSYMEFSIGSGINFLVYEQPLQDVDVRPLGDATIEDVKKSGE